MWILTTPYFSAKNDTLRVALASGLFILSVELVAKMAIWFMAAVSIISAVDYFWGFWKKIDKRVARRRRRPFILSRRKKKALEDTTLSAKSTELMGRPQADNNPAKAH